MPSAARSVACVRKRAVTVVAQPKVRRACAPTTSPTSSTSYPRRDEPSTYRKSNREPVCVADADFSGSYACSCPQPPPQPTHDTTVRDEPAARGGSPSKIVVVKCTPPARRFALVAVQLCNGKTDVVCALSVIRRRELEAEPSFNYCKTSTQLSSCATRAWSRVLCHSRVAPPARTVAENGALHRPL